MDNVDAPVSSFFARLKQENESKGESTIYVEIIFAAAENPNFVKKCVPTRGIKKVK